MHHIRAVLKFVLPSAAAFAVAGLLVIGSSSPGLADTSTATVSMGEASVLSTTDSGNGNHLLAQQAALPQDGTLQDLSFYVANAAGKLRLAVYDSSGPGGAPGTLEAQTPEITPVVGWNTVAVTSPTVLQAGYYWLAYLASDNGLAFKVAQTGIYKQYALPYGALPTAFNNAAATSGPAHWSFYGTLQTTGSSAAAATTTGSPTTRAAWFYSRPTDGTTPLTVVQRSQTMILSGSDYEVGFLGQVRSAGWTKPILEYVDEAFAMGPSSAMTGTCASGYTGYTTTWTSGLNDFCNKVSPNESWFLHNGAGQRIYRDAGGGSYFYLMNPAAPGWRSFVQAKTASLPASYHMDGVFLDDVWATANRPRSRETNSDGTCRECGTDAQWLQAQVGMVQAIKAAAGTQPVWVNSDSTTDLVAPVDGFMIENMGASWGTSFMSQAEVEQRLRDVDANVAAGKDALLVGQGNQSDVERMRFSHAIYLLVAGPHVSYRFQNAGDYRALWDYPEYRLDLGDPSGPRYPVGSSVWRRDFSAGTAIVNLSNTTSQTVDLGSAYTLPGGGTATSVTLAPDHGMALSLAGSTPPVAVPGSVPNVRVSAATASSVTVAWDAASGTVGGYRLLRGGSLDGTTSALQWQFSGLSCGTSYSFAVQAYNASGSGSASTISASTAACPPPPPVAVPGSVPNVRVSAATASSVTVAWDAASGTVGGYRLLRGGSLDGTTSALQWQFSGLSCGTSYSFAVQAYNASGSGSASTISASTAACPPPPPVAVPGSVPNVRVSAATASSVTVAWDAASGTVGGYRLLRGGSLDGTTSALQWQFSGLSCGTSYSFAVQAYNASGSGSASTISAASAPCGPGSPTNTGLPTVRGQDAVGSKLRGSRGTWSGHPSSYLYQWLRCDSAGENCAAIAGGTAQNYVQRSVDQGLTVRLQVTATNGVGSAKAVSRQSSVIG